MGEAVKRGDRTIDEHGEIRVMAVADGYVMVRRPGCLPFVLSVKEFLTKSQELVSK